MRELLVVGSLVLVSGCADDEARKGVEELRGQLAIAELANSERDEKLEALSRSLEDVSERLAAMEKRTKGIGFIGTGTQWERFSDVVYSHLHPTAEPGTSKLSAGFAWSGACPKTTYVGIASIKDGKPNKLLFNEDVKLNSSATECNISGLVVPVPWSPKAEYKVYYVRTEHGVESDFAKDSK